MAFASDSMTAPARPLLLLAPFVFRPSPPADDPRSADELLKEIARETDRQAVVVSRNDTLELPPEPLSPAADQARTLHLRRQLAQAAEHGAALLASVSMPRLVGPDHIIVDPVAAADALDIAIATLDALDGDTELEDEGEAEPSLGWTAHVYQTPFNIGSTTDAEHDTSDAEPSLASPERHPTIPLSFRGNSYTARGGEEGQLRWAEGARDDREKVDEDGPIDDDELDGAGEVDAEPSIGWPEDVTAEVVFTFSAEGDAEHDDVDLEGEPAGDLTWVFGPSRREVAHV